MTPRVSILIPAYNAAPYIDEALESVRAQIFDDWEIVAVDDASTDGTWERLRAQAGGRVRIDQNSRNLGMTGNWNRCLSLARGELVHKLDADDVLRPGAIGTLAGAFDDQEVIAAGMRTLQCDEQLTPFDGMMGDDVILRAGIDPYRDVVLGGHRWYDFAALGHQLWSASAFMVRREVLTRLGPWDERFGHASDTELIWRILEEGKPVAHLGAVGVLYRRHDASNSFAFVSRGWGRMEGLAANLLSLSRARSKRPLRRALRMHYVRLWSDWHRAERTLPEPIQARLDDVIRHVTRPPLVDVLMTRARDAVSE